MHTQPVSAYRRPTLFKQLLGAGVGMIVALAVFEGYSVLVASVSSTESAPMTSAPRGELQRSVDAKESARERSARVAAHARELVERLESLPFSSDEER